MFWRLSGRPARPASPSARRSRPPATSTGRRPAADTARHAPHRSDAHAARPCSVAGSRGPRGARPCATRHAPPATNPPCRHARSPIGWRRCRCERRTRPRRSPPSLPVPTVGRPGLEVLQRKPVCVGPGGTACFGVSSSSPNSRAFSARNCAVNTRSPASSSASLATIAG